MMAGILVWDVVYYLARYEGGRYFVFVSRWSLITQFAYLFFSFLETLGYSNPRVPVASFLFKIALPASVAVIPLYWGQLLYGESSLDEAREQRRYWARGKAMNVRRGPNGLSLTSTTSNTHI